MKIPRRALRPIAVWLALSLCGGALFNLLRIPLPWMLGPLFFVGFAGINSVRVNHHVSVSFRLHPRVFP
jgi:uncharacterized membrane protein AbrB (regulator of aidB expression)